MSIETLTAPTSTTEPEFEWFVVHDVSALGGDGTFYTGDLRDLWSPYPARAAVLTRDDAQQAIEDCDEGHLLRHRLRVVPAWQFGRVPAEPR